MLAKVQRKYILGLVTFVYSLSLADRNLIIVLLEPIRKDLNLSDTQLGFLTGIAFGLFYSTLGLPFARWADRGDRVTLMSIAIGLWGLAAMSYALVKTFAHLALARVASAVGETGCQPPTYSLLGDYFPRSGERVGALTIYLLAGPISTFVAFSLGARLSEEVGWRMTFFLSGIPALAVALLVKGTLVEPRISSPLSSKNASSDARLVDVLRLLWGQKSLRHLSMANVGIYTFALGLSPWYAAFLARNHGMTVVEVGTWLGAILGACAALGTSIGGFVGARLLPDDVGKQLVLSAIMLLLAVPLLALFLLLPEKAPALVALMLYAVTFTVLGSPMWALMQRLVPEGVRARTFAMIMLVANLVGMGLGPFVVGVLSDELRPLVGNDSLRYAMLSMSTIAIFVAYQLMCVRRTASEDLRKVELWIPRKSTKQLRVAHVGSDPQ